MTTKTTSDDELAAMETAYRALAPLPVEAQGRVMTWITRRLESDAEKARQRPKRKLVVDDEDDD